MARVNPKPAPARIDDIPTPTISTPTIGEAERVTAVDITSPRVSSTDTASARAPTAPRRSRTGLIIAVIALIVVLGLGTAYVMRRPAPVAGGPVAASSAPVVALSVTVMVPTPGRVVDKVIASGTIAARDELALGAEATGLRVVEIMADENDVVRKDQILARLNDDTLSAELAQKQASVTRAEAAIGQQEALLREAEANLRDAESNLRRAGELSKTGAMSAQTAETRATAVATATARVASARQAIVVAKADLTVAEAQRREAEAKLRQTEIRAPTDGRISSRTARLGQIVSQTNVEMFRLIRDGMIELNAAVAERDLPKLRAGQPVRVVADGIAKPITGEIRLLSPTVDTQTRLGIARITVPGDSDLRPGMFARAEIDTGSIEALLIPEKALLVREGKPSVFIVGDDRIAHLRQVEIGLREAGAIQIRKGLAATDRFVIDGAGYLKDGDPVTPQTAAPDTGKPGAGS